MPQDEAKKSDSESKPQDSGSSSPGQGAGQLKGIIVEAKGNFVLELLTSLVPGGEDNDNGDEAGAGNSPPTEGGSFAGPGHGGIDFGSGPGEKFTVVVPIGNNLAEITATLRPRKTDGTEGANFAGGGHGSFDFGSPNAGSVFTLTLPVTPVTR